MDLLKSFQGLEQENADECLGVGVNDCSNPYTLEARCQDVFHSRQEFDRDIPPESIAPSVRQTHSLSAHDMVYEQYTTFLTEYNSDTGSEESFEEVDGSMLDYMFDEQETEEDNAEKDNNEKREPTFH